MQAHSFKVDDGYCSRVFAVYIKVALAIQTGWEKTTLITKFLSTNDNKVVSAVGKEEALFVVTSHGSYAYAC